MDTLVERSLARRLVVLVGAIAATIGAAWGSGAFGGTPIQDAAGGALGADATVLAPGTSAFAIWSVIYTVLFAFAVFQALPARATDVRTASIDLWMLASLVLNALWIAVIQAGWLWLSVVVIASIVVVLGLVAMRLVRRPPRSWIDRAFLDLPVGLYLGWVCVATVANIAAAGAATAPNHSPGDGAWAGVVALVAVALLAVALAWALRKNAALAVSIGAALAWGTAWIAIGRLTAQPHVFGVGVVAVVVAIVAIGAPIATVLPRRRTTATESAA